MEKDFIENFIQRLIDNGTITEETLKEKIQAARGDSPLVDLQSDNANLLYDSMMKDSKIEELENQVSTLFYLTMTGGN